MRPGYCKQHDQEFLSARCPVCMKLYRIKQSAEELKHYYDDGSTENQIASEIHMKAKQLS